MTVQLWDVWQCQGWRTSWRATPHRDDDALKPRNAVAHWDTVEATSARAAVRQAIKLRDAV